MAREHFTAAAGAVAQGFQMGASMRDRQRENARADRRMAIDDAENTRAQGRYDREMAEDDLDAAVRAKKREKLAADIDLDLEMRRDELKRMSEADDAFSKFTAGADLIDWGTPEAPTQYEALTRQYLPGILKHEKVAKKWEALDGVAKKSQAFTANKLMEAGLMRALTEAAQVAPDVLLAPPTRPDGKPDFEAIRNVVRERQKEIDDQALELRRAGRAPAKPAGMSQSQRMELDLIRDELKDVNKSILEMDAGGRGNPDARLQLQNRKASLMRQLRRFDAMEAPAAQDVDGGASSVPQPQAQDNEPRPARQSRVGRFKVSVEE